MKNVLFIAYYFPPMGGAGVQKSIKFVKYLKAYDYNPIVLTVKPVYARWIKDKSLIKEIPEGTIIYRTPTIDINWINKFLWGFKLNSVVSWLQTHIFIPDSEITWLLYAKIAISRIVTKHKIDIAYISGGPFSSMLLGPYLKKNYNVKYVLDFRDEWTNNPSRLDSSYPVISRIKDCCLEKAALSYCSGIIYTIPQIMKKNFESKYDFLRSIVFETITNGFDEEDFTGLNSFVDDQKAYLDIVYTGTFYDRRKPVIIWKAITELVNEKLIDLANIRITLIGKNKPEFVLGEYYNHKDIRSIVRLIQNLERTKALQYAYNSSLQLLYIAPGPNCKAELTGKIFDYLRTYRPILAIIPPDGVAAEIINQSKCGFVYDSSDIENVKKGICEVYNMWQNHVLNINPDIDYIAHFNRKLLTQKLASVFDRVLDESNASNLAK